MGQFILVRRKVYEEIGGHEAIKGDLVEDKSLGEKVSREGFSWGLISAKSLVKCRMYESFKEAHLGFSRWIFPTFGGRIIPFIFAWIWVFILFYFPLIILIINIFIPSLCPFADLIRTPLFPISRGKQVPKALHFQES